MNKSITAVIAESGKYHDLNIGPGTTTRDIRNQLGLSDQYLISRRGAEPFGEDENIYGAVSDGEKLFLSTPVEVGTDRFSLVSRLLPPNEIQKRLNELRFGVVATAPLVRPSSSVAQLSKRPVLVQRDSRPYWEQRGWTFKGGEFLGYYRIPFGSWKGKAKVSPSNRIDLFIQDPPSVLRKHSHWSCFRWRLGGSYFIHAITPIADLSSGILEIEKILMEAHAHEQQAKQ